MRCVTVPATAITVRDHAPAILQPRARDPAADLSAFLVSPQFGDCSRCPRSSLPGAARCPSVRSPAAPSLSGDTRSSSRTATPSLHAASRRNSPAIRRLADPMSDAVLPTALNCQPERVHRQQTLHRPQIAMPIMYTASTLSYTAPFARSVRPDINLTSCSPCCETTYTSVAITTAFDCWLTDLPPVCSRIPCGDG